MHCSVASSYKINKKLKKPQNLGHIAVLAVMPSTFYKKIRGEERREKKRKYISFFRDL